MRIIIQIDKGRIMIILCLQTQTEKKPGVLHNLKNWFGCFMAINLRGLFNANAIIVEE